MSNGGDHRVEIEELRRQLIAKDALLAEREEMLTARATELAAAKNGLIEKTLEAEKLKAQLAKLRREKFGASSERIERAIEQFELALEEIQAAKAETTAPTSTNQPEAQGVLTTVVVVGSTGQLGSDRQEEAPPATAQAAAPRRRACAGRRVQSLRRHRAAPGRREHD